MGDESRPCVRTWRRAEQATDGGALRKVAPAQPHHRSGRLSKHLHRQLLRQHRLSHSRWPCPEINDQSAKLPIQTQTDIPRNTNTHARTHTHAHTHTHTHIQTRTHATTLYMYSQAHCNKCINTQALTICTFTHTHISTPIKILPCRKSHTNTHSNTAAHLHSRIFTHINKHIHLHILAHEFMTDHMYILTYRKPHTRTSARVELPSASYSCVCH
jgi:hypothetical protein